MKFTEEEQAKIDKLHQDVEKSLKKHISKSRKQGDKHVLEKGAVTVCNMVNILKQSVTTSPKVSKSHQVRKKSASEKEADHKIVRKSTLPKLQSTNLTPSSSSTNSKSKKIVRKSTLPKIDPCKNVTTVNKLINCLDRCCFSSNAKHKESRRVLL